MDFQTVLCAPHNQIDRFVPVRDIHAGASWLQIIHDTNVSNKLRGWRIRQRDIPKGFVGMRDEPIEESALAIALENMTLGVIWALRDNLLLRARWLAPIR